MMNITVNHQNNPEYESLLDDLIREVFGFSFAPWFERKLWDERYESYSIVHGSKMLANVCIYNDFYPRFGFQQVQTYSPRLVVAIDNGPGNTLQYSLDDDFVRGMLYGKRVYSKVVDSANMQPVQMFHLLMEYSGGIYYLPGCDALVVAAREDDALFLADVITQKPIVFDELLRELPFYGVKHVKFGFNPDRLGISPTWEPANRGEEPFFVKGDWNLPKVFCFPAMSIT